MSKDELIKMIIREESVYAPLADVETKPSLAKDDFSLVDIKCKQVLLYG